MSSGDQRQTQLPTAVTASESGSDHMMICFVVQGLKAPRSGVLGWIKGGCNGAFEKDYDKKGSYRVVKELPANGGGLLELRISDLSIELRCELKNPSIIYEQTIHELPDAIVPSECCYRLRDNVITIRVKKAAGSESWAGAMATRGLDQRPG